MISLGYCQYRENVCIVFEGRQVILIHMVPGMLLFLEPGAIA